MMNFLVKYLVIKMNKVYYVSTTPSESGGTGIGYKIYKQMEIMKKNGFDVHELCLRKEVGKASKILSKLPFIDFRADYELLKDIEDDSIVYIRYFLLNVQLFHWIKTIRKKHKNIRIIVELPTYPYDFEYKKYHPYIMKDRFWRKKIRKYVDKILTFSDDKVIYGIDTINISNGVDITKIKQRIPSAKKDHTLNMIAVAKFSFWHGYDRMILGIADYIKQGNAADDIRLYIVGYGDDGVSNFYKELIQKNKLDNVVILTGKMQGEDLDDLYNRCDLAIDSMGRHRSGVKYNSSLKGKEYLAKGLPVVSGVRTELDNSNFRYYFRVPADDTPVNMNQVIDFYHRIYDGQKPEQVASEIRAYCEEHFDIEKCFLPVIQLMNEY